VLVEVLWLDESPCVKIVKIWNDTTAMTTININRSNSRTAVVYVLQGSFSCCELTSIIAR
jgi:hypothetical protein